MEVESLQDGTMPPMSRGLNVHRGGPPPGPYRGFMGNRSSSRPSTSAAAYNTVAATPRNYLIHVYKSRDDLVPFVSVEEFNKLRDRIKTSIWSFIEEHGADKDLSVKNWAFHREKYIGLIFCTLEARQKRVIEHMITNDLGGHVVESASDLTDGMKMSFKMPVCFESQQMATLIEAIFVINELSGHCGHRELRTDRPRHEDPYTVYTVHFPESFVEFSKQHEWRLQGPDGMIFLYGTGVSNRRRANFEKAQARKAEEEAYRAANPTPPPLKHPQVLAPPSAASVAHRTALVASIEAAKGCTIVSELVPTASGAEGEGTLMAQYPHLLMVVVDMTEDYPERPPNVAEAAFRTMSKSVRQRWIRKVKKYVACLRMAHRITEDENVVDAAVAEHSDLYAAEAPRADATVGELLAADEAPMMEEDGLDAAAQEAQALPDGVLPAAEAQDDNMEKPLFSAENS
jgi:hypothetical protein